MVFTKDSVIVKSWVALILAGTYTIDDVPNIGNLREVVQEVLDEHDQNTEGGEE